MTKLPAEIEVLEPISGAYRETHYRLPPRSPEIVKHGFRAAIGGAVALFCVPFIFSIFFAVVVPRDKFEFWLTAVLMPIFFFGFFLYPIALVLLIGGFLHRWARIEIQCLPERLHVVTRSGWFRWTMRLPIANITGLRVETGAVRADSFGGSVTPNSGQVASNQTSSNVASLFVDRERGGAALICWNYPPAWLLALADDLTERIGLSSPGVELRPVTQSSADPNHIEQRTEQPSTSDARVSVDGDTLVIDHPARGFWRGVPGFLKMFGIFWNGFMVMWTFTFMPALFAGEVKWNDGPEKASIWFGLLFCTPFYLVGFGFLVYFYAASIYAARWTVRTDQLEFWERKLFGEHTQTWSLSDLTSIRALRRQNNDEDKTWSTLLEIVTNDDNRAVVFSDRDKAELEWLATTLSKAAGLSISATSRGAG